jgi:protein TonB
MPEMSEIRLVPPSAESLAPALRVAEGARPAPPSGAVTDVELPEGDNIVPFRRPPPGVEPASAKATLPAGVRERPAPRHAESSRTMALVAALLVSVSGHAGLYVLLNRPVEPRASIGLESMSVELVLGADAPAGRGPVPTEQESDPSAAASPAGTPDAPETPVPPPAETAAADPPAVDPPVADPPAETPVQPPATVAAAASPTEAPSPVAAAAPPPDPAAVPSDPVAVPVPPQVASPPARPPVRAVVPRPEPRPPARPKPRGSDGRDRVAALVTAAPEAGGPGRGRSDRDSNYPGLVAAHLARFKRFPAEARAYGGSGAATVRFVLDGGGRVRSVALVRGSGNPALDRESVEVVRRSSPFPAPPDGRSHDFTQPIRFNVR